jgi:hypothetical protein
VGPRVGLDVTEKRKFVTLVGIELRPLGRPASCQSLHRLRYPGSKLLHGLAFLSGRDRKMIRVKLGKCKGKRIVMTI